MKDKTVLIAIAVGSVLLIVVIVSVVMLQNARYSAENAKVNSSIKQASADLTALQAQKDTNNFTPTEVVIDFLNEVKSDNTANAKLYLSSSVQNMDIKNTLKLGSDLANINIGDNQQNISGSNATVDINIQSGADTVARSFAISKENDAWKIVGITAE